MKFRRLTFLLFAALFFAGCIDNTPVKEGIGEVPAEATVTDSGLAYVVLTEGSGPSPNASDTVRVHYTGWTTDGRQFDSSVDRGEPAEFALNEVIAGWTEGVALMKTGETTRFWIPQNLAYQGRSGAPEGMLVFDIELIDIL